MRQLSVVGVEEMELIEAPRPVPAPHEVLIDVAYVGICGSDFPRYFEGGVHAFPQVLGHEFSGTVVEVGEEAAGIAPGDRVAVAPLVPCGTCDQCETGHPALCRQYSFIGSRQQGALAENVAVPAKNCVVLPEGVSLRDAALIEPLTVALHGLARVPIPFGSHVAVFGAGVIGLLATAVLAASGTGRITCIDISDGKLELARRFGATDAVLNEGSALDDHFTAVGAPDVCIELAGLPQTQVQSLTTCRKGGAVVFVGTGHRDVTFTPRQFESILRGELWVTGAWMSYSAPFPGEEWRQAVRLLAEKRIDVGQLVSRVYSLEEGAQPFHDVRDARGDLLKVLYRVNPGDEAAG